MNGFLRYLSVFTFLSVGISFGQIQSVQPTQAQANIGESVLIDVFTTGYNLAGAGEFKFIKMRENTSGVEVHPINVNVISSNQLKMEVIIPKSVPQTDYQSWEVYLETNSFGSENFGFDFRVAEGSPQPIPLQVRRSYPVSDILIDTGNVGQKFQIKFVDLDVRTHTNWQVSISSNGVSKITLTNVQAIDANTIEADLNYISLLSESPNFYISSDQLYEQVLPNFIRFNHPINPTLTDIEVDSQSSLQGGYAKQHRFKYTFQSTNLVTNIINNISLYHYTNFVQVDSFNVLSTTELEVYATTDNVSYLGQIALEINTDNWFKQFQNTLSYVVQPEMSKLIVNEGNSPFLLDEQNSIGIKLNGVDLSQIQNSDITLELKDQYGHSLYSDQTIIIGSDSLEFVVNDNYQLSIGMIDANIQSYKFPDVFIPSAFTTQKLGEPFLDHIIVSPANLNAQFVFSQPIRASSIVASSQIKIVFDNGSQQELLNVSLDPLMAKPDQQVYSMALSVAQMASMVSNYSEYGNLGRIEYEADIFTSLTGGVSNFEINQSSNHWVFYNFKESPEPIKLDMYSNNAIDFNHDTLNVFFDIPQLGGINQDVAVPLGLIIENANAKDTVMMSDIRPVSSVDGNKLKVNVSSIKSSLYALLDQNYPVKLILAEGAVYNSDSSRTSIAITEPGYRDLSYFGHNYNSVDLYNGPLWLNHASIDFSSRYLTLNFSGEIDSNFTRGNSFSIQVQNKNGLTDTIPLVVGDSSKWVNNFEYQSISGSLDSVFAAEIESKMSHGFHLSLLVSDNFARSPYDLTNIMPSYLDSNAYFLNSYSTQPYVENVNIEDNNSRLTINFNNTVNLDNEFVGTPVQIQALKSDANFKLIDLIPGPQNFNEYGYQVEVLLNQDVQDSILSFKAQGYLDFRVVFPSGAFKNMNDEPVDALTKDNDFKIYPWTDGQSHGGDFRIEFTNYNLIENRITLVTNSILNDNHQPATMMVLVVNNSWTGEMFNLNINAVIEYDPENPNVASFVLPRIQAKNLERTYGFLEYVELSYPNQLLQNQAGEMISNASGDGNGIYLATQPNDQPTVKKVQLNTDTYHLQVFFKDDIILAKSPFLMGNLLSTGEPSNIVLSVVTSSEENVNLILDPKYVVVTPTQDLSAVEGDRELVFDLSNYKSKLEAIKTEWDNLFLYADSGAFTFEARDEVGDIFEKQSEVLANVTLTNSSHQSRVDSVYFENSTNKLFVNFSGQVAPDYQHKNIGIVSFESNGESIYKSMDELSSSDTEGLSTLTFNLSNSPAKLLGVNEGDDLYVYVGSSVFTSRNQLDGAPFIGWNTANLTQISGLAPDEVEAPEVGVNFLTESTINPIGKDIVYSRFADFRDSVFGQGEVVDLIPGFDLYFKHANTPGKVKHLGVPARPINTIGEIVWDGIQILHRDSNLVWRESETDIWERGDHSYALIDDGSQGYQYRQVASPINFASNIQTIGSPKEAPVWKPTIHQFGTALQIDFVQGAQLSKISNASYKLKIKGPQGEINFEGNSGIYQEWPLDTGAYVASYELYTTSGDLLKEDQVKFTVSDQVVYHPVFEKEDHSNWYMLGVGNNTNSVLSSFNEGAGAFKWIDDAPIDDLYGKYVDLNRDEALEAGEGYWLYNADTSGWVFEAINDGVSEVRISTIFGEDGWQQISNPWSFPIKLSAIKADGRTLDLWEWNPEMSDFVLAQEFMKPGIGYFVRIDEGEEVLLVQDPWFPESEITTAAPPFAKLLKSEASSGEWSLNLKLKSGQRVDDLNLMGISSDELENQSDLPNSMGENLHLNFADGLLTDFRMVGEETYFWDVNLASNVSGLSQAQLEVEGLENARSQGYNLYYLKNNKWQQLETQNLMKITQNEQKIVIQATKLSTPSLIQISNNINLILKEDIVRNSLVFEVKIPGASPQFNWSIVDSRGQEVFSKQGESNLFISVKTDDLNLQEAGVYFLNIQTNQGNKQSRLTFLK